MILDKLSRLSGARFGVLFAAAMLSITVVAIAGAGVSVAISSTGTAQDGFEGSVSSSEQQDANPEAEESEPTTVVSATPEAAESAAGVPALATLPDSCDDIYSSEMRAVLASHGVQLNPSQTGSGVTGVAYSDSVIDETIRSLPSLRCFWGDPGTRTSFVMETRIAAVTDEQSHGVQSRLASLGYIPIQELGSTRYYFADGVDYYGRPFGESHIVVGGYWFATTWSEVGINGYTADMVRSVLG